MWNGTAQAAGAKVAIMYSDSSDAWMSPEVTSQGSAKRTLYVLLKHMGLPTDIVRRRAIPLRCDHTLHFHEWTSLTDCLCSQVTEDDCVAGNLNHYGALYIIDSQISEAAVTAIGAWVNAGGHAFITAGGGMLNEFNLTNIAMQQLLPVTQSGIWTGTKQSRHNATIYFAKQDLPYAEVLDEVTVLATDTSPAYSLSVLGDKSIFTFTPAPTDTAHVSPHQHTSRDDGAYPPSPPHIPF